MKSQLARLLIKLRERQKLTQAEVAEALGYTSGQFISNFERGISLPPLKALPILASIYKVPIQSLIKARFETKIKALKEEHDDVRRKLRA
jgi:transcriptional regulator with XRE-family HTH domain